METLLLTGTISPSKDIIEQGYKSTSIDPKNRYLEYLNSIIYYITQSDFKNIVFCENSNYDFKDLDLIKNLCRLYNKNFELLQFNGDYKKSLELGYGYGDGECMDYAVDNSKILKNTKNWYKISGRYIIKNINKIIENNKKYDTFFFKQISLNIFPFEVSLFGISTYFFKISNNKYISLKLHNIKENMNKNTSIEFEFYKKVRKIMKFNLIYNGCINVKLPIDSRYISKLKKINHFGLLNLGFISYIIDKLLFNFLHKKS